MYVQLKKDLLDARKARDAVKARDILGVVDAVDKNTLADRKKLEAAGKEFLVADSQVISVLKNQIKNMTKSLEDVLEKFGPSEQTDGMQDTIILLSSYLPPRVEGDDLRHIIQTLGAGNMGQAMGMLKKTSLADGFDYDAKEASLIAKDIFV